MSDFSIQDYYDEFIDEIMFEADSVIESQPEVFFNKYNNLGAEAGDFPDLSYNPFRQEGTRPIKVCGYAFEEEQQELYLVVNDFENISSVREINFSDLKPKFNQVERFFESSKKIDYLHSLEESSQGYALGTAINERYKTLKRVKFIILSNAVLKTRKEKIPDKDTKEDGINIKYIYSVFDFKRYNNLEMKNNESTEIEINVQDFDEKPLQNILASDADENIKSYLAVMPGTLLSKIYARYGARVL